MIIGQATARHFFGFENPIGKTIALDEVMGGHMIPYRVVAVVKDTKYQHINEPEHLSAFVAAGQDTNPQARVSFEVRFAGIGSGLAEKVRSIIVATNPSVSLEVHDLETQVNESMIQPRVVALLSTIFGLLALLLAAVGLYGITAYSVSRRRNEIGIRLALGARRWSVIWLALRDMGLLLIVGIAAGLCASLALGRLIRSLLYRVQANDPRQLACASLILAVCAVVAAYLPARRAAGLDPLEALREE
jgi:ABC-type antimicrobial peptide transport system permease subunit